MSDEPFEDELPQEKSKAPSDNEHGREDISRENCPPGNSNGGGVERRGSSTERSDAGTANSEIETRSDGADREKSKVKAMIAARARKGPLPAVEDFSGYDGVLPGAANRIMEMAEKSVDAHHQTALADADIQKSVARSIDNRGIIERRQQIVFSLVTILALLGTFVMAWFEKTVPSVIALIVAAAGGYATFKTNRDGFKLYPSLGRSEKNE